MISRLRVQINPTNGWTKTKRIFRIKHTVFIGSFSCSCICLLALTQGLGPLRFQRSDRQKLATALLRHFYIGSGAELGSHSSNTPLYPSGQGRPSDSAGLISRAPGGTDFNFTPADFVSAQLTQPFTQDRVRSVLPRAD